VLALNKIDLLDEELRQYLGQEFPEAIQVSAVTGEGTEEFRDVLEEKVRELGAAVTEANGSEEAHRVFRPTWRGLRVENEGPGAYRVSGEEIERTALKTDWDNPEGVQRFQRELEKKGVVAALRRAGAETGDEVRIGASEFDFQ
jgi:GTP-binding protein